MFNGYNDSGLISYEFNQEREKKLDNVSKYAYGYDGGVQSTPTHPNNRQSEYWSGKPNFVGVHNVVKCNCPGCYPIADNQSYQVQSTHHRPWLPKTHSVPLNGSNECKLPAYQWDNALNQMCYPDSNVPYGQESGGKYSYYRQFPSPNQPGVIISANKQKSEMGFQNGVRQSVMCNPGYDLGKRVNGRSYYDGDKCSLGNQIPRLPVEPYTKAVPSNLNQNRVPSTGHRKENSPQCDLYSGTKVFPENYHPGLAAVDVKNTGIHVDYSYFNRDSEFYRNNYDVKRNSAAVQNRKDCSLTQTNIEQHYGRPKHPENMKGCEMYYPNLEKSQMESCIQRIENDGLNCLPRPMAVCNDLRYADERPQVFPYQNNASTRNYIRPEYSQFSSQCVSGYQETNQNQCRILPQQLQNCDQQSQGNNGCFVDSQKGNSDKMQSFGRTQLVVDAQPKLNYLETIRSEDLTKNGTNKISPLRLLRKKKVVTPPQELSSVLNPLETPALDVRKFWSTWAEEEDENVSPTEMVVLDCQNLDPEQAKLLNFCETDPSRPINFDNVILKNSDWVKNNGDVVKTSEEPVGEQNKLMPMATQMGPMMKSGNEIIPELETINTSPKKCEHRKKKVEEVMDKWTEKKFDFLKKSEDSKAAEMIRYEEEKKKIFERRLSFQQVKRSENSLDGVALEENSQSGSPREQQTSDLPTCEYRRNKFLDYSEVITNGWKDQQKSSDSTELKKGEPDVKQEGGSPLQMNDILRKITDINFQDVKLENGVEKKGKKTKKKKSDQAESDAKTDLKLETASKPTIKFSIQKSHDLKISFKVLNKKYEEEVQSEETKPIEDVNTELITLKYKSIQNGDKVSNLKKKKGKPRRKKHAAGLKAKKSKYAENEPDPLAINDKANAYSTDDFQVQETVDSAKIKLTFKRHKNNLETEYKVNSDGLECQEDENNPERSKKKLKKAKKHKIPQIVSDIQSPMLESESMKDDRAVVSASNCSHESTKDFSENSSHLPCSINKETDGLYEMGLTENQLCELTVEESNCNINDKESFGLMGDSDEANGSNEKFLKFSSNETVEEAISNSSENREAKEEIQGISLDFIRTINSPDIETNRETEKTEEKENRDLTDGWNKNGGEVIESTNKNHSNLESSYDLTKNLVSAEIKPVPLDKDETLLSDVTKKDELGDDVWGIESHSFNLETNTDDHSSSKPLEKNADTETSKIVEKETKNELEEILLKIIDSEENVKSEVNIIDNCEPLELMSDKGSDREHSESPNSPLLLNKDLHQPESELIPETDLSDEPNQVSVEDNLELENLNDQSNSKDKLDLETEMLTKFHDEELETLIEDQAATEDKHKTFFHQSEPENSDDSEKEKKLYELEADDMNDSKFYGLGLSPAESEKIEFVDTSSVCNFEPKDGNFADQAEPENIIFDSDLLYENSDKNTREFIEKLNQKDELICDDVDESAGAEIDEFISISNSLNAESIEPTEPEMEVICDSQNSPQTPAPSLSQTDDFVKNNDDEVMNESQVELDLSVQTNDNAEVDSESFPQVTEEEVQPNLHDRKTPETCPHLPDGLTTIAHLSDENESEVVIHFEGEGRCEQIVFIEKPNEKDERLDTFEAQKEILIENNNQPDIGASSADHSGINSPTDAMEIKLNEAANFINATKEIPSNEDSELEDGEIVDNSSDDSESTEKPDSLNVRKIFEFKTQKPVRRHSIHFNGNESLCQRKFKKSKSCPPRLEFKTFELHIPVEDIPLPIGPPPLGSCYNFCKTTHEAKIEEVKEKLEVPLEAALKEKEKEIVKELPCGSPFGAIELKNCRNPSPPCIDAFGAPRNKIKFTLMKRNRFSKINLYSGKPKVFEKVEPDIGIPKKETQEKPKPVENQEVIKAAEKPEKLERTYVGFSEKSQPEVPTQEETQPKICEVVTEIEVPESTGNPEMEVTEPLQNSEPKDVTFSEIVEEEVIDHLENVGLEVVEPSFIFTNELEIDTSKIRTPDFADETVESTKKGRITEVPNSGPVHGEDKEQKSDFEVESLCEDTNVEIVDVMNDFMRDEFYEDIPTSEDLPNGDSVDEKVNDDKFRNIMQNCLDNAKKFLNVGNLKLFSCSVEDLVGLDNQENESAANHISRDVLLTSCEDTNDDLSLNEKFQPTDISMEFIPSDVCPEILPVDNWPYLEEEVPSSPLKSNEADMILENAISEVVPNRKRSAKEPENHKRFRRKSFTEDDETNCSTIAAHRRKTVDEFNGFLSYAELDEIDKPNESLKCRLSLEKLTKNGMEFICPQGNFPRKTKDVQRGKKLNYKSPTWQPKVMLIRISEKEVRRFKKIKIESRTDENLNSIPTIKRHKSDEKSKSEEKEVILSIPPIESIHGLITTSSEIKKHKPRFRNLHTKEKSEHRQTQPKAIETALGELFNDSDEESKNDKVEKTNKDVKVSEGKHKSEKEVKNHSHKEKHDHRERRKESEREHHRHKEKRKHERTKQEDGKRRKSSNSEDCRKVSVSKSDSGQKEAWVCEVCGFNDASERVAHIKNHPFHCQSCHLAFKTEAYFTNHLTEMHKDIRNQHHCLLCELSFDTEEEYQRHLETREHTHLEAVEKNTINTLFTLLTGAPCPVLGLVEMKPEWLPNQAGTVHFYHQATPLSLALQYLKMHRDLTSRSEVSKLHPN